MFRCKRQYTESRSEAPVGYKLPAASAPEHNTTKRQLDSTRRVPGVAGGGVGCGRDLYSPSGNTRAGRGPGTEEFSASGSRWILSVTAPRCGSERTCEL